VFVLALTAAVFAGPLASEHPRVALARALMRFECALQRALDEADRADGPTGGTRERLLSDANARFDRLSLGFFAGRYEPARTALDELTVDLLALEGPERERAAAAMRAVIVCTPRFIDATVGGRVRLEVEGVIDPALPREAAIHSAQASLPVRFDDSGVAQVDLPSGLAERWRLRFDGIPFDAAFVDVLPASPEFFRREIEERLERVERSVAQGTLAHHPQSLAALRSRVALMMAMLDAGIPAETSRQSGASTNEERPTAAAAPTAPTAATAPTAPTAPTRRSRLVEHVLDASAFAAAIDAELTSANAGVDTARGSGGGGWRELDVNGIRLPLRVGGAVGASQSGQPLIVALHGAGGDENMFMEAYGGGLIDRLAVAHGAIVVAPLTTVFSTSPRFFDAIVDEMVRCHGIDRRRVVMLGHSMGAAAVASIVGTRGDRIAAAAMIAGGAPFFPQRQGWMPPVRIDAGEFDPLVPAVRLERGADSMRERGVAVTFILHAGRGHTLLVAEVLPQVVSWLLDQPAIPVLEAPPTQVP